MITLTPTQQSELYDLLIGKGIDIIDKDIHQFAKKNKLDVHELESYIYGMAAEYARTLMPTPYHTGIITISEGINIKSIDLHDLYNYLYNVVRLNDIEMKKIKTEVERLLNSVSTKSEFYKKFINIDLGNIILDKKLSINNRHIIQSLLQEQKLITFNSTNLRTKIRESLRRKICETLAPRIVQELIDYIEDESGLSASDMRKVKQEIINITKNKKGEELIKALKNIYMGGHEGLIDYLTPNNWNDIRDLVTESELKPNVQVLFVNDKRVLTPAVISKHIKGDWYEIKTNDGHKEVLKKADKAIATKTFEIVKY